MGKLLAFLAVLMLASTSVLAQKLDQAAFRTEFIRAFEVAVPNVKVAITGDMALEVTRPDKRTFEVNLANVYRQYAGGEVTLKQAVQAYVNALTNPPDPPKAPTAVDRSRIVPVIKRRAWLEENQHHLRASTTLQEFITESFAADLIIVYAEDSKERTRYLTSAENIGVDRKELRALAVKNLQRLLPKIMMANADDTFMMIDAGGDYEASLLLFDDIWSGGQIKVDGDIVVSVPAKDTLIVTGSKSRKGLKAMREAAAKYVKESRFPLTETLFVYRDGRFRKFGRD